GAFDDSHILQPVYANILVKQLLFSQTWLEGINPPGAAHQTCRAHSKNSAVGSHVQKNVSGLQGTTDKGQFGRLKHFQEQVFAHRAAKWVSNLPLKMRN